MTKLKRVCLTISPELLKILDQEEQPRNSLIEDLLWSTKFVRDKAKNLRIQRPPRNTSGRPKT